jgi:hypothetical protein
MGLFRWLFGQTPLSEHPQPQQVSKSPSPTRRTDRTIKSPKLALVIANFDPDGDQTDFEWNGFHMYDEDGRGVTYSDAEAMGLEIFRVAGVSYRKEPLQRSEFAPGRTLRLIAETDNQYDRNAVSVWDASGKMMVGYVPKERNRRIRAKLNLAGNQAMAIGEHRKDGGRVSLTVMFGPMSEVKVK